MRGFFEWKYMPLSVVQSFKQELSEVKVWNVKWNYKAGRGWLDSINYLMSIQVSTGNSQKIIPTVALAVKDPV